VVGTGLYARFNTFISDLSLGKSIAIITHPRLRSLYVQRVEADLIKSGYRVTVIEVAEGESSKSLSTVALILDQLVSKKFERNDTVIAFGGGVIGDLSGFVASIYLRGIRFVQVPTTLLSQVDAAIGGKTGVNHPDGKNLIGSFYQPSLVLCDMDSLLSLSARDLRSGLAEVVKYGAIKNAPLFEFIQTHCDELKQLDVRTHLPLWRHLVESSAEDKAYVVMADERESDLRAILNFGHTIGHGIEAACHYGTYTHGECVAIGMVGATYIAVTMKLCSNDVYEQINSLCQSLGFDVMAKGVSKATVFEAMTLDKKVKNGVMRFVLPTAIGAVEMRNDVSESLVQEALHQVIQEDEQ
jgi:3-dehydroquinate synthase